MSRMRTVCVGFLVLLLVPGLVGLQAHAQTSINEIRVDQPSTDTDEYFELTGSASASLAGMTYLVIGDSAGGGSGVVEEITDLAGQSLDGAGLFVAAEGTFTLGTADLVTDLNFENGDSVTHLLVSGFTGALDQDLDTNDDGVLDITPWTTIEDCIGLVASGSANFTYCATTLGPDGTFLPAHSFRCSDGFRIGAFDPAGGDDTPGAANVCGVSISIDDVEVTEGDAGTVLASFTVSLSDSAPVGGVSFDVATSDGTAMAPGDYLARSETGLTIAVGGTSLGFDVTVNGDGDPEPDETFMVTLSNVVGAAEGDLVGIGTISNDDALAALTIGAIQGSDPSGDSPFAGQMVTTEDNVVTALAADGFVMQAPAGAEDGDPDTSDGIFVFTDSAPTVSVGDQVDVSGMVSEFFGHTQIGGMPTVSIDASGLPLPAPVAFDAATPSPLQPQSPIEYERFESMRVSLSGATVSGSNQRFGTDPIAEVYVTASGQRAAREPGIEFPGLPLLPVWDGNPEVFELDPDRLGLANQTIFAGATFDATGILGFEFSGWELWPTALSVTAEPDARAVRARGPGEVTVGSLNLLLFFDDVDDPGPGDNGNVTPPAEYLVRLEKLSLAIRDLMGAPDVLAVQEAEHLQALQDLADRIAMDDPGVVYTPYLEIGNGNIQVGYLVREDIVTVDGVTQLGASEIFAFDGTLLHDRPPLRLDATLSDGRAIVVLVLHQRSLNGIDDPMDGDRVRNKRLAQAQSVAQMVQDEQDANPNAAMLVVGDFNAFEFTDGYVDVLGQIRGEINPADNLLFGPDLVDPNLINLIDALPASERYSFVFRGSSNALDHAVATVGLAADAEMEFARGNADAPISDSEVPGTPRRSSDHDGLVVFLQPAVVFMDGFESGDTSVWTATVP